MTAPARLRSLAMLAASLALLAAAPPAPVPGGRLGTLVQGYYTCESPGDAAGPVGVAVPGLAFKVVNGSSYKADGIRGSYLLTGDVVTMTGGPLKGLSLHRISQGFLRRIEADGSDGAVRCVLGARLPDLDEPAGNDAKAQAGEDGSSI